jgi:Ca2+-binding RTX toxin-like protein
MLRNRHAARLRLQTLEDRTALSAVVSNGDLHVYGTTFSDNLSVRYESGYYRVIDNGVSRYFTAASVWGGDVFMYGYGGNDVLNNLTGLRLTAYGADGNDTLYGNGGIDYLHGGNGRDTIYGYGGADTLVAGSDYSANSLYGGDGNDALYGGYGNDALYGHGHTDTLYGNWGDDFLDGGSGTDYLYGEAGNDTLNGGNGSSFDWTWDYLSGGTGTDWFRRDLTSWNGWAYVNRDSFADYSGYYDWTY